MCGGFSPKFISRRRIIWNSPLLRQLRVDISEMQSTHKRKNGPSRSPGLRGYDFCCFGHWGVLGQSGRRPSRLTLPYRPPPARTARTRVISDKSCMNGGRAGARESRARYFNSAHSPIPRPLASCALHNSLRMKSYLVLE